MSNDNIQPGSSVTFVLAVAKAWKFVTIIVFGHQVFPNTLPDKRLYLYDHWSWNKDPKSVVAVGHKQQGSIY